MKDVSNLFAFSPAESKVLKVLSAGVNLSVADLVRVTRLPRTSIIRTIASLKKRGLLVSIPNGKRTLWKRQTQRQVEHGVMENAEILGISSKNLFVPGFALLQGKKALTHELWEIVRHIPRNGRFSGIQPTTSALISTEKMGAEEVIRINEYIKSHNIIVEAVHEDTLLEELVRTHGNEWLQSFSERMASTATIPKQYIDFSADIYITVDKVMLANWQEETGVLIENIDVVRLLRAMFRFLHDSGRRFDNNELARALLNRGGVPHVTK